MIEVPPGRLRSRSRAAGQSGELNHPRRLPETSVSCCKWMGSSIGNRMGYRGEIENWL